MRIEDIEITNILRKGVEHLNPFLRNSRINFFRRVLYGLILNHAFHVKMAEISHNYGEAFFKFDFTHPRWKGSPTLLTISYRITDGCREDSAISLEDLIQHRVLKELEKKVRTFVPDDMY